MSPWEARSYDGSLSEENGRASAEAAIAARISWISSEYRIDVPEAVVQALDDTTIVEVLELNNTGLGKSCQGHGGRPKKKDLNSLRLWALEIKMDPAAFRLDACKAGRAAAKEARQVESGKLIVKSQRAPPAITRFDPAAAARVNAYMRPMSPATFPRLYYAAPGAAPGRDVLTCRAIVSMPYGDSTLLDLLEPLGE